MATTSHVLTILFSLFTLILANVEKTIFLGPETPTLSSSLSSLNSHLDTLTPANGTLRTQLAAHFPTDIHPLGTATWLILDNLTPNQRYEVRVCWPAIQPTAFQIDTFPLSTVQDSPDLLASLRGSSKSHQEQQPGAPPLTPDSNNKDESSILLLRVLAAADYFTTDAALMRTVPPVDVDIILDPFLFNVLPRSLAGTACYIVVVAVVACLVAGQIASKIQGVVVGGSKQQGSIGKKQQ